MSQRSQQTCQACLRRQWLLETLSPRLDRARARIDDLLEVGDEELIEAVGGAGRSELRAAHTAFGARDARRRIEAGRAAGLDAACLHAEAYPSRLRELAAPPAVLWVNGGLGRLVELCAGEAVAVVGTRRATSAGRDIARSLGEGLATAGVSVVSGMAFGIDTAAHLGALDGGDRVVVVLAGSPAVPTPRARRALFERVLANGGVVIGEITLATIWRWALQARNRLIAGLADMTVIVEAPARSGALITARHAGRLRRWVGAVPGPVTSPESEGANRLLAKARAGNSAVDRDRVVAIRGAQDVLDVLYGEGIVELGAPHRPAPTTQEAGLLTRIEHGLANVTAAEPADLVALAGLELKGWVTRGPGGTLSIIPGAGTR